MGLLMCSSSHGNAVPRPGVQDTVLQELKVWIAGWKVGLESTGA